MIKIVVTTYCPKDQPSRGGYLGPVLESLDKNIVCDNENVHFVVANDGDPDQAFVKRAVKQLGENVTVVGGPRSGIGGSLNRSINATVNADDVWFYTTDDWLLTSRLDLTQSVKLIREAGYDYVRVGPPHPNVNADIKFQQGIGWWLKLHVDCGGFVFATRPFLATRKFYDKIGPFKEQCDSYVCERDYSDRVNWNSGLSKLAETIHGSLEGPWEHIGEVSVGERYP